MSEANESEIDKLRDPSELPHHWKLRKEFLKNYQGKYDQDRLVSLSHLFVNITCYGLTYPQEVMDTVEKLAKTIDTKLIEEATIEESYESRDSESSCDEPQQQHQQQQHHHQQRYNNHGGNNYNNHHSNNQSRNYTSNQPFSRPYSRPRFHQSNHDNRHQPYQQQQQPQQAQQQPQQYARYSDQPRFFRPQELRPRSDRPQGSGHRQPFYQPRQRGNYRGSSDGFNRRNQQ